MILPKREKTVGEAGEGRVESITPAVRKGSALTMWPWASMTALIPVGVERMIGRGFAKLRDHLCKAARVRGSARRLAGFKPGSQPLEVARLLHQLEEQIAHVEVCRGRGKTFDQRWHRRHGGPPADPSQSNQIAGNPHHAEDRDQVFDLRPVMKTTPTDHDVSHEIAALGVRHTLMKPFTPAALLEKIRSVIELKPR